VPSATISSSTLSPLSSTQITSSRSTVHFRPARVLFVLSHFSFRSTAHWPQSRPCKTHFSSNGVSVIMVLNMFTRPHASKRHRACQNLEARKDVLSHSVERCSEELRLRIEGRCQNVTATVTLSLGVNDSLWIDA